MVDLSVQIEIAGGLSWARWKRLVAEVDRLGYRGLYCCDHFYPRRKTYLAEKVFAIFPSQTKRPHIGYTKTRDNVGKYGGVLLGEFIFHDGILCPIDERRRKRSAG